VTFLLDTNAFSDLMAAEPRSAARLGSVTAPDRVVTCTIVRGEILYGIERMPSGARRDGFSRNADALFSVLTCEPLPAAAAEHYARTKQQCRARGVALDENDLWIAATCLWLGATLVTRDRDFTRVPGLMVEDWTV
jgi:predicted nucleic acid-binding protein